MSNGFNLEPKNGDFVRYIEQMQAGGIASAQPAPQVVMPKSDEGILRVKEPQEIVRDQRHARVEQLQKAQKACSIGIILGFVGFALGGMAERTEFVLMSMGVFMLSALASGKVKKQISLLHKENKE